MEQFLSSVAFKGTIAEAIGEAKLQKKLFVVYIAGDKPESKLLETSTWSDPTVLETLTKYCIFLHILEGSSEASYFSAIYPQNNTPCVTVIGYNGVRLWQKEGFVAADVLSTSLEKAWLSLHLQETTAAFLTATLASRISGSSSSEQQTTGASSEQRTAGEYGSLPLRNNLSSSLDAELPKHSEAGTKRNSHDDESDPKMDGETIQASHANILTNTQTDGPKPTTETQNAYPIPEGIGLGPGEPEVVCPLSEKSLDFDGLCSGSGNEISRDISNETVDVPQMKRPETAEVENVDALDSPAIKSNNVFFNIRLPDGSLQANFSVMDTLRVVHEYINDNQTSRLGPFDLAIPYPRHVFGDQDLDSTLSSLGLFNRQKLIVVPRSQTNTNYRERSSVHSSTDPSSSREINEGYWTSVKRILSYVNPLSYLSGGAASRTPSEELPSGSWQYNPNASQQNNARGSSAFSTVDLSDKNTSESGKNSNSRSRQRTYGFGANIHTLKRDEDDNNDKNIFWNGNSTQFGGSHDGR